MYLDSVMEGALEEAKEKQVQRYQQSMRCPSSSSLVHQSPPPEDYTFDLPLVRLAVEFDPYAPISTHLFGNKYTGVVYRLQASGAHRWRIHPPFCF